MEISGPSATAVRSFALAAKFRMTFRGQAQDQVSSAWGWERTTCTWVSNCPKCQTACQGQGALCHTLGWWAGPPGGAREGAGQVQEATHHTNEAATGLSLGKSHRNHIDCPILPYFKGNDEVAGDRLSRQRKRCGVSGQATETHPVSPEQKPSKTLR